MKKRRMCLGIRDYLRKCKCKSLFTRPHCCIKGKVMIRYYVTRIETVIDPDMNVPVNQPKYIPAVGARHGVMFSGLLGAGLVAAVVTQEQHDVIMTNDDVASAPENIDQNISDAAIPKIKMIIEQLHIPAEWIDNTYTYRQILRMIAGLIQFSQAHRGLHRESLIDNQSQLDLRWNQIPQARRQRIRDTADSLNYVYSEVQNNWLVRRILKYLGDQWGNKPFEFLIGVEL